MKIETVSKEDAARLPPVGRKGRGRSELARALERVEDGQILLLELSDKGAAKASMTAYQWGRRHGKQVRCKRLVDGRLAITVRTSEPLTHPSEQTGGTPYEAIGSVTEPDTLRNNSDAIETEIVECKCGLFHRADLPCVCEEAKKLAAKGETK